MEKKTKGQIEAKVSDEITKFEREYMGRGPQEARTYIIKDMIFIRLTGVLTPSEVQLSKTPEGAELIKKIRMQLIEGAKFLLEKLIFDITTCHVKSLHTDISTRTGERIIIFTLEENCENKLT